MRRSVFVVVVVLAVAVLCSCTKRPQEAKRPVIAVVPKATMHLFWKSVHAGAVKAAAECDVEVLWKGPLKEDDRESQITVVENLLARGVAGIVLAPLDDTALRPAVAAAKTSGVPVVIMDSGLKGEDYVSFVATDNFAGGQKAGEHLAKLLGGKGRIVVLRYQQGSDSTTNRERGFLDAIARHPGIEVVSSNQYAGPTVESAMTAGENLLTPLKKPDGSLGIDGIFCPCEPPAFAVLRILESNRWAGQVKLVAFDSSPMLVKAMREGHVHGLVLQDPINIGYLAVKTLVAHLRGVTVERFIDTGSEVATPENMDEPHIKALLEPDYKSFLGEE